MRYRIQESECILTENVSGGAATEVTISGLVNTTTYSITVAAVNSAGTGEHSNPIKAETSGMHKLPRHYFCFIM